ncbi:MAG: DUF4832 domain-containing protein [Clostridia bacterium]|nr:DUF4832 domain-containing protein [Clostridia bacterium]
MKRILSLALALMMAVSCFSMMLSVTSSAAADSEWTDVEMSYKDSTETIVGNPGCGLSGGGWNMLGKSKLPDFKGVTHGLVTPKFDLGQFSGGNDYSQGSPVNSENPGKYTGYEDKPISEEALAQLDACFAAAEKQGIQMIPRFAYTWSDCIGCEPATIEMIELHIKQISEVINKYKDTVISVECGIIGPWGEMHSSKYQHGGSESANRIIGAYLNNLDPTVTVQVRTAGYITQYLGRTLDVRFMKDLPIKSDDPRYRLGMYNDGYLGTWSDYGTWPGGVNLTRAQAKIFLSEQNKRIPYGGEMAYCTLEFAKENGTPIYQDNFIEELYMTHLSYLDNIANKNHSITQGLLEVTFEDRHDFEGMPNLLEYYGTDLQKFMLDHMGYRFVMRSAQITDTVDPGKAVKFRGTVENTGFGNLLAGMVAEVILVGEDGEPIVIPVDVDPQKWYTCEITDYNFAISIPADAAAGEYNAFIRFSSLPLAESAKTARTIRFANKQPVANDYGANYIGTFNITGNATGVADGYKQVYVDFTDVKSDHWGKGFIEDICTLGLMGGVGNGKFNPEGIATRAQFVTVLYNMEGKPAVDEVSTPLTDIDGWYNAAIKWAYSEGIVNGVSATKFDPNGQLTRETFATMLYRYAKFKGIDVESVKGDISAYKDAGIVSSWALEPMLWANAKAYIGGMTADTLVPQGKATRAQMATIMTRYLSDNK